MIRKQIYSPVCSGGADRIANGVWNPKFYRATQVDLGPFMKGGHSIQDQLINESLT